MIAEFFKDREIFITGGSGIVGKALIEKLLRSCNVGRIYILLRPKKRLQLEERLEVLKRDKIFSRLKSEKPDEFDVKVTPIPGDVELPLLGITPEYMKLLENVSIVYHSAATVRFDEPLLKAIRLNIGGTLETLRFAENLKRLEVFMHVSTFYSNPYLEFVEPKSYESPMDWKFCLDMAQRNDIPEEIVDILTRKLIIGFPNTYCFTKNLAESLVNEYQCKLPVAIYRPSIIIMSADEEPEIGFPTKLSAGVGLYVLMGAGLLKVMNSPEDVYIDFAPQDVAIKSMAYYSIKTAKAYASEKPFNIPIYHTAMCPHTGQTYAEYIKLTLDQGLFEEAAFEKNLLLPGVHFTENNFIFMFLIFFKQILPAILADLLLLLFGRKPGVLKAQRRIFTTLNVLLPFTSNTFKSDGISNFEDMLEELHGTEFNIDIVKTGHEKSTIVAIARKTMYAVREILWKEDPSTLPRARKILKVKKILYRLIQLYLAYKLYTIVMHRIFHRV
ncbi:fatty acyl-CoA reductase wat-like [Haematobia irritans]|uniref:fatty acyl-CoA reductase wat-like n=1 Tax=Haematobia irritans TaxID=7368 RepID=UPI003F4FEEEC